MIIRRKITPHRDLTLIVPDGLGLEVEMYGDTVEVKAPSVSLVVVPVCEEAEPVKPAAVEAKPDPMAPVRERATLAAKATVEKIHAIRQLRR